MKSDFKIRPMLVSRIGRVVRIEFSCASEDDAALLLDRIESSWLDEGRLVFVRVQRDDTRAAEL